MVLSFRLRINCSLIATDFDFIFLVLHPEQQEMVSMEQIIAIQKREEAAQKAAAQKAAAQKAAAQKQQSAKETDQSRATLQSGKEKGREKGITIKEGASQAKQTTALKAAPCRRRMEKKGLGSPLIFPLPLGNAPTLVVQWPWFLLPWKKFRIQGC